jgi:uncharacterized membrane protein
MLFAMSAAWSYSIGLLVTFLGIGVLVNLLLALVGVRIAAERQENRDWEQEQVTG